MSQPQLLANSTFNYIKPSNESLEPSGWMSISIPSFFRKPSSVAPIVNPGTEQQNPKSRNSSEDEDDGEPFDLSDEEIDAVEAYALNQGIPRELSISGAAPKLPNILVQPPSPVKISPEPTKTVAPLKPSLESNPPKSNFAINRKVDNAEVISPTTGFFSKLLFNKSPTWWSKEDTNNDSAPVVAPKPVETIEKVPVKESLEIDPFEGIATGKSAAPPLPAKPSKTKMSAIRVLEASNKKMRPGAKLKRTPIKHRLLIRRTYESAREFLNTPAITSTYRRNSTGKALKVKPSPISEKVQSTPLSPPSPRPTLLPDIGARKEKKWKPELSSFDGDVFSLICSLDPESITKPTPAFMVDSSRKSKVHITKLDPLPVFDTEPSTPVLKSTVRPAVAPLKLVEQEFFDDDDDLPLGLHYPNSPLKAMFELEAPQPVISASTVGYGKVTRSGSCPDFLYAPRSPVTV